MRFEPAADSLLHHKVKEPLETKEKQKSLTKENVENEYYTEKLLNNWLKMKKILCVLVPSCWEASNLMNDSVPITTEKVKFPF